MKRKSLWQALTGVALLVVGGLWVFASSRDYTERHVVAAAGACRVDMNIVEKRGAMPNANSGAVVLFHGIAANKLIMAYLARSFAELGVAVYVPDLPGHGRTPGPFTPQNAQDCALSLVRGLAARGMIAPERTILAGHSMGAAIALRIAPEFRPAGVIAISPAPMKAAHGVTPQQLLFQSPPQIRPNTLITTGQLEPLGLATNAADLAAGNSDPSIAFRRLPHQTHVSVLFSPGVARMAQAWAARVLDLSNPSRLPSLLFFAAGLLGFAGILLLSGPFLREMAAQAPEEAPGSARLPGTIRFLVEMVAAPFLALYVLRESVPLRSIGLFEGDYLASFFLLVGLLLILAHPRLAQSNFKAKPAAVAGATLAAFILHLLVTGWFELTVTGAWLTWQRWTRLPLFFLGAFLFCYALEILLGPVVQRGKRLRIDLLAILLAWLVMACGALYLHSGQILMVLLMPYFALFFVFSRMGARLVRQRTTSATAAAVFGAILLAGFCLVLFPVS